MRHRLVTHSGLLSARAVCAPGAQPLPTRPATAGTLGAPGLGLSRRQCSRWGFMAAAAATAEPSRPPRVELKGVRSLKN